MPVGECPEIELDPKKADEFESSAVGVQIVFMYKDGVVTQAKT